MVCMMQASRKNAERQSDTEEYYSTDEEVYEEISSNDKAVRNLNAGKHVPMMLTDPQVFNCCQCHDTLSIPVYQLEDKCPMCLNFIGDKRCRALESVMDSVKTPCSYTKHGCKAVVRYSEKREHEKTCTYVPCVCPQQRCNWISNSYKLGQHYNRKHFHKKIPFQYGKFFDVKLFYNTKILILQAENDGKLFVINNDITMTKGSAVFVYHIGPNSMVPRFHYEIKVDECDGATAIALPPTCVEISVQGGKMEFGLASNKILYIPIEMLTHYGPCKLKVRITNIERNERPKRANKRPPEWDDYINWDDYKYTCIPSSFTIPTHGKRRLQVQHFVPG
ncbi:hypothetical protein VNO78_04520 [Psophocarpus tetragonolobus]|uniref:SIAH-type domain-containing protein n=1 Tax=Psophocarpus tetragonolobus TaxID=3891 RepID=A0AAN9XWU5_PSOTE